MLNYTSSYVRKYCIGMAGNAKHAAQLRTLRFIINNIGASREMTQSATSLRSVPHATKVRILARSELPSSKSRLQQPTPGVLTHLSD
jgi:hypothetical protein